MIVRITMFCLAIVINSCGWVCCYKQHETI